MNTNFNIQDNESESDGYDDTDNNGQHNMFTPSLNVNNDAMGLNMLLNQNNQMDDNSPKSLGRPTFLTLMRMVMKMMKMMVMVRMSIKTTITILSHHHFTIVNHHVIQTDFVKSQGKKLTMKKLNCCINLTVWRRRGLRFLRSSVWNPVWMI
jgi:hypothetical protein